MNLFPQIFVLKNRKIYLKGSGFLKSYLDGDYGIPIGFAMALSTNIASFNVFLSLSDEEQRRVLSIARSCKTQRERQLLANGLYNDKK